MLRALLRGTGAQRLCLQATAHRTARGVATLPAHVYTDPKVLDAEHEAIFKKEWQYIGASSRIREPGQYLSFNIANKFPIFVIRDSDGTLKAFYNVCPHRGGPMVLGACGKEAVLRCKYHGWVFDRSGTLKKCPGFNSPVDMTKFSLHRVRVDEWRGLIWANLSQDGPTLKEAFGDLLNVSATFDMESCEFHSEMQLEVGCNWKAYVDNFQEFYHVDAVHPDMGKRIRHETFAVHNKKNERWTQQTVEQQDKENGMENALWGHMYPNTTINMYDFGMHMERVLPLGPNRTVLKYDFFGKKDSNAQIDDIRGFITSVVDEDASVLESTQDNLNCGIFDTGVLSHTREEGVEIFKKHYLSSMGMN